MAQKTIVDVIDDIDGSPAEFTNVQFGIDGVSYEIDLSEKNLERLREVVKDFVAKARRVGGRAKLRPVGRQLASDDPAKVREWALANGYELSDRGRIPNHIVMAYDDAKTSEAKPAKAAKAPRSASRSRGRGKQVG
jgi:hypothetical protein